MKRYCIVQVDELWKHKLFGENKADSVSQVLEIPVLARLWWEDGVWNGEAIDLPIAVFGDTFEDAVAHLQDAVMSHLESLVDNSLRM
jgi:predicted RNase H-like HicB family nuclease